MFQLFGLYYQLKWLLDEYLGFKHLFEEVIFDLPDVIMLIALKILWILLFNG